ncbi:SGNH/GDSL hydrolase family protein [Marinomonas sp.]|uniref:SGNH/GDSL hydrolase family protein n=1 Tax=Marinomonas sp. TaxID=1904862 RepID=UPI003BAD3313
MQKKRVLCYGDSNTWAPDMDNGGRLNDSDRWTGRLAQHLGKDCTIIEEGLSGRTTVLDDPYEPFRNGRQYLTPCLLSHQPLDLVIIMLGTNDLKSRFNVTAEDIGRGINLLCNDIKITLGEALPILIVAPAALGDKVDPEDMFASGIQKSRALGLIFKQVAEQGKHAFFDASNVITLNHHDGIHLSTQNHHALGDALAPLVRNLLGTNHE